MKKLIVIMLTVALVTGLFASVAYADTTSDTLPLTIYGTIVKAADSQIEIKNEQTGETLIVNTVPGTYCIDAVTGAPSSVEERTGDRVVVYYGPNTSKSIPPQAAAVAIAVNLPEKSYSPKYAVVEAVERLDNQVKITTDNGGMIITIDEDTPISPYLTRNIVTIHNIDVGTELMLWYDIVAMSYPGQATSLKTVILGKKTGAGGSIIVSAQAGVASVNGVEVDLDPAPYTKNDDTLMLPLRLLCESLGYEVKWIVGTAKVELIKDGSTLYIEFYKETCSMVDSNSNIEQLTLDCAPEVDSNTNRSFVSVSFFENILDVNITINEGHV